MELQSYRYRSSSLSVEATRAEYGWRIKVDASYSARNCAGLGIVVYRDHELVAQISHMLSHVENSYHAERMAMMLAMQWVLERVAMFRHQKIAFMSDSQALIGGMENPYDDSHAEIWTFQIYRATLESLGIQTQFCWIARELNRDADGLARDALQDIIPLSLDTSNELATLINDRRIAFIIEQDAEDLEEVDRIQNWSLVVRATGRYLKDRCQSGDISLLYDHINLWLEALMDEDNAMIVAIEAAKKVAADGRIGQATVDGYRHRMGRVRSIVRELLSKPHTANQVREDLKVKWRIRIYHSNGQKKP